MSVAGPKAYSQRRTRCAAAASAATGSPIERSQSAVGAHRGLLISVYAIGPIEVVTKRILASLDGYRRPG